MEETPILSLRKQPTRMWCNTECFKRLQRCLSWRKVLLTPFHRRINDEVPKKKDDQLARNMHIQTNWLQISFHGGVSAQFFSHLLIPKPIHGRMEVSETLQFVKCDQIKPKAEFNGWILRICMLLFSEVVSRFLNPQVSSGHITKPTQFGSELAVFAHMRPRI